MAGTHAWVVGRADAEERLDRYLVRCLPKTLSRSLIQRAIRQGLVRVDGRAAKPHQPLKSGQTVVAKLEELPPAPRDLPLRPEPIPLEIIYEDAELLVVNKPPGLVTHPAPGHWAGTLVNAVLWHLHSEFPTPNLPRAGLVHRLDKDTSGLLVIAKTDVALRELAKQLKARTMRRRYLALVEGHVPFQEGTVDAAIGRHLTHRTAMAVRYLGGREALTRYRVIKRGTAPVPYTLLDVSLQTGRTHQIRVHMAHLGHPVLGDPVYSRRPSGYWQALGISRQLLHAAQLQFLHPVTQRPVECRAPLPADFAAWAPDLTGV